MGKIHLYAQQCLIGLVRVYQWIISPFIGEVCRFYPSCSEYFIDAINKHGVIRGTWLLVRRLSCCHPLHQGGYDPVPEKSPKQM